MENQKSASKKIMINYGLLLGFVSVLIAVANYAVGDVYRPHWIVQVGGILVTLVILVYAIKLVKDANGGFLKLGEALKVGLGVALINGLIYVVYMYVFSNYVEPTFFENVGEVQRQVMMERNPNLSDEQLEAAAAMQEKFTNFGMTAAVILIWSLFSSFVISLIAGLIMKRTEE